MAELTPRDRAVVELLQKIDKILKEWTGRKRGLMLMIKHQRVYTVNIGITLEGIVRVE